MFDITTKLKPMSKVNLDALIPREDFISHGDNQGVNSFEKLNLGHLLPNSQSNFISTIIGTIELSAFPVLMEEGKYSFIGAWLGFKLIGQWDMWKANRLAPNRFVIATAIQILVSYFILKQFVCV